MTASELGIGAGQRRVLAGLRPSPGVGCHRSSRYPVNPGMYANSLPTVNRPASARGAS
jgi:hypothetical protein